MVTLEENQDLPYPLVWVQCSDTMISKVEDKDKFIEAISGLDVLSLLKFIT